MAIAARVVNTAAAGVAEVTAVVAAVVAVAVAVAVVTVIKILDLYIDRGGVPSGASPRVIYDAGFFNRFIHAALVTVNY